jgi:hypothetical protein
MRLALLLFAIAPAAIWLPVLASEHESITLIGQDENGEAIEIPMAKGEYMKRLRTVSASVVDSAIPALAQASSAVAAKAPKWMLRTFVVGVGVGLEAGLGPIIKIKAVPRFKLVFADSVDPILP